MAPKVCNACQGKGFIPEGCPHCQGKGGWFEWAPDNRELKKKWIPCDKCGGTGNGKCPADCNQGYIRL
jgi:DnaJ-class molecular chaperone